MVAAFGLATPQWTPLKSGCPKWMEYGFALFDAVGDIATTDEVFPSATYRQVEADPEARLTISLADLHLGPKDMLDAYLAAYTVRELGEGRGVEVGGGDGLGTIALARPLGIGPAGVLAWPTERPTPVPR